jgi:hypothetical protein
VVAGTTSEGAALATVGLVGVGSDSNFGGGHVRRGRFSGLCSYCRRSFSHCGGGLIDNGVGHVSPQFLWSWWSQSLWWRADRQGLCSGLASVPSICVASDNIVAGR